MPGQTKKSILSTVKTLESWGSEIRLKEYYPYHNLIKKDLTMDDIRKFNRSYFNNQIEDLSMSDYVDLIFPKN